MTPDRTIIDRAAEAITSAAADGRTIASPVTAAMALAEAGLLISLDPMPEDELANCIVVTGAIWGALMGMPATKSVEPEANTLLLRLDFMGSPYRVTVTREPEMF
jgi:hypothetical protein